MARVPFPDGFKGEENLPRTRRSLENCFNNKKGEIISRPCVDGQNTTDGVARGHFVWNGKRYVVSSQDLLRIDNQETGAFTKIGDIAGVDGIRTAVGFVQAVIVDVGGETYSLDKDETLITISNNANFVPNRDVAFINGRFVYVPFDGEPAYFSDIGEAGVVQPESFFDAEEVPDKNRSVFNYKNTLYIGGTDSIELFRDAGTTPNPFAKVNGGRIENGTIGPTLDFNETVMFVGREAEQSPGIYAIGQGFAPKLSNSAVDLVLDGYTEAELEEVIVGRIKWRGYDIATFTFRRDAFGFFAGEFFPLTSLTDGIKGLWKGGHITEFAGKYYSAFENRLGVFAKINTDYGEPVPRIIDTAFEQADNDWFGCQSIDLGISQGYNENVGSVALFMSRDGVTYSDPLYRTLGAKGEYGQHLIWNYPGGLGRYEGFMGVRIYTTEDVDFSGNHLIAALR